MIKGEAYFRIGVPPGLVRRAAKCGTRDAYTGMAFHGTHIDGIIGILRDTEIKTFAWGENWESGGAGEHGVYFKACYLGNKTEREDQAEMERVISKVSKKAKNMCGLVVEAYLGRD